MTTNSIGPGSQAPGSISWLKRELDKVKVQNVAMHDVVQAAREVLSWGWEAAHSGSWDDDDSVPGRMRSALKAYDKAMNKEGAG